MWSRNVVHQSKSGRQTSSKWKQDGRSSRFGSVRATWKLERRPGHLHHSSIQNSPDNSWSHDEESCRTAPAETRIPLPLALAGLRVDQQPVRTGASNTNLIPRVSPTRSGCCADIRVEPAADAAWRSCFEIKFIVELPVVNRADIRRVRSEDQGDSVSGKSCAMRSASTSGYAGALSRERRPPTVLSASCRRVLNFTGSFQPRRTNQQRPEIVNTVKARCSVARPRGRPISSSLDRIRSSTTAVDPADGVKSLTPVPGGTAKTHNFKTCSRCINAAQALNARLRPPDGNDC